MTRERVHELARGRVWTGADALANGLVDELGGLDRAAAVARRRAGLPAGRAAARLPAAVRPIDRLRPPTSSEPPAPRPPACSPRAGAGLRSWRPGPGCRPRPAGAAGQLDIRVTERMLPASSAPAPWPMP